MKGRKRILDDLDQDIRDHIEKDDDGAAEGSSIFNAISPA